jgi:hypothetical protein
MEKFGNLLACDAEYCSGTIRLGPERFHLDVADPDELRRRASAKGWTSQGGKDYCPAHSNLRVDA